MAKAQSCPIKSETVYDDGFYFTEGFYFNDTNQDCYFNSKSDRIIDIKTERPISEEDPRVKKFKEIIGIKKLNQLLIKPAVSYSSIIKEANEQVNRGDVESTIKLLSEARQESHLLGEKTYINFQDWEKRIKETLWISASYFLERKLNQLNPGMTSFTTNLSDPNFISQINKITFLDKEYVDEECLHQTSLTVPLASELSHSDYHCSREKIEYRHLETISSPFSQSYILFDKIDHLQKEIEELESYLKQTSPLHEKTHRLKSDFAHYLFEWTLQQIEIISHNTLAEETTHQYADYFLHLAVNKLEEVFSRGELVCGDLPPWITERFNEGRKKINTHFLYAEIRKMLRLIQNDFDSEWESRDAIRSKGNIAPKKLTPAIIVELVKIHYLLAQKYAANADLPTTGPDSFDSMIENTEIGRYLRKNKIKN